jgi:hypothetical protein
MKDGTFSRGADLGVIPLSWTIAGTGDFKGDGTTDSLWRNSSGMYISGSPPAIRSP